MCAIEFYTYEDYKEWEGKWELIEGVPMAMAPSPLISHQAIANMFAFEFTRQLQECEKCLVVSEEDWKVSNDTVLKPDVSLICNEPSDKYITKAPEIIVEVISPSTARRDEKFKFEIYESEKVKYYILAYPKENKAKLYKLTDGKFDKEGDFFDETYKFDGLSCDLEVNFDTIFKKFRK